MAALCADVTAYLNVPVGTGAGNIIITATT